jgi:sulfite exporter TauE/SafE
MFSLTSLAIGFLGSFHCVTMCGPIALALSGGGENNLKFLAGRSVYNLGRIVTYGILGLLAGLAGHTLLMAGFQKSFSITIGILMVLGVILINYIPMRSGAPKVTLIINKFIKSIFSKIVKQKSYAGLFTAGLANGILPCGFVYLAMAGAAATQSPIEGAGYMVLFGLGTFPAMMMVAAFGKFTGNKVRLYISKAAPVLMIALGLLFIYRGYTMKENSCCHGSTQVVKVGTK